MAEAFAVSIACLALAIIGCGYVLTAAVILAPRLRAPPRSAGPSSPVTILKPLHGAEAGLYENLSSFCAQGYPRPGQILFRGQGAAGTAPPPVFQRVSKNP